MADSPKPEEPDFSAVESSASSTAPILESTTDQTYQTYTVVSGDSLSKISKHFYGEANHWRRIFDANRDILKDPDLIHPGQTLKIPSE